MTLNKAQLACLQKGKKGSVSFFVLLFILAALFFFQSYLNYTTSDYNTGWDLDDRTQRIAEEANLRIIVKQALLTYYERGYFTGQNTSTVAQLINVELGYLNANNEVNYRLTSTPALPARDSDTFWPFLSGDTTLLNGAFSLTKSDSDRDFDHVNDFLDPTNDAFEVQGSGSPDFPFVFTRSTDEKSITVNARMWQVPVTDFNLYAYGVPVKDGIPSDPPSLGDSLSSSVQNGSIRAIALSQIGSIAGQQTTTYPFYYRELFSAGAQVWQGLFYGLGYYNQFKSGLTYINHDINKDAEYDERISGLRYRRIGGSDAWQVRVRELKKNLLITSSGNPSQDVYLVNGSDYEDSPIVIYAFNRYNTTEMNVHIRRDISRPVLFIGENVNLILDRNNLDVYGAWYLDRYNSSDAMTDNNRNFTIHGSFAWKGTQNLSQNIKIETYNNDELRLIVPRFLLVDTF